MSVKELKFDWPEYDCKVNIDTVAKRIRFIVEQHNAISAFELDRNQAHLLYLYLKERFEPKAEPINKTHWHCDKCKVWHKNEHVCVRI